MSRGELFFLLPPPAIPTTYILCVALDVLAGKGEGSDRWAIQSQGMAPGGSQR